VIVPGFVAFSVHAGQASLRKPGLPCDFIQAAEQAAASAGCCLKLFLISDTLSPLGQERSHLYLEAVGWEGPFGTAERFGDQASPPIQLPSHLCDNMLNVRPQPRIYRPQLGHSVQMLLSTYARWLNSSSDWSELEKLKIGIKSVSAENPAS